MALSTWCKYTYLQARGAMLDGTVRTVLAFCDCDLPGTRRNIPLNLRGGLFSERQSLFFVITQYTGEQQGNAYRWR